MYGDAEAKKEFYDNIHDLLNVWLDVELRLDTETLDLLVRTKLEGRYCAITIDTISLEEEDRHFVEIDLFVMEDEETALKIQFEEDHIGALLMTHVQGELRWSKIDLSEPDENGEVEISLTRNELVSGLYDEVDVKRINDIVEEMEAEFESVYRLLMNLLAAPDQDYSLEVIRELLKKSSSSTTH